MCEARAPKRPNAATTQRESILGQARGRRAVLMEPVAAGLDPGTPQRLIRINTIGHKEDLCVGLS